MGFETPGQAADDALQVLIVDDDPIARRGIARLLERNGGIRIVGEASDAKSAIEAVPKCKPDVVLLDIEMPGTDGFHVADSLQSTDAPYIIFVTAYDRYAVEAFQRQALDYVLKPVAPERLADALTRARTQRDARRLLRWANRVHHNGAAVAPGTEPYLSEILVRVAMRDIVIRVDDIDWIEADSYYARLHVAGKEYLLREPLHRLERRLDPAHFVRVHRSAIVNVRRVKEVRHEATGERQIVLSTGARIRVSRNRWRWFAEHLRERTRVGPARQRG